MSPSDIPIHDIKPLMPIPDISLYIFSALVAAGLLAAAVVAMFLWRLWRRGRKADPRIAWLRQLDSIDFSDAKRSA